MKKIIFLVSLFIYSLPSYSQKKIHFISGDGTSANVEIISSNADDGRNNCVYGGFLAIEGLQSIAFSKYKPTKYYLNIMGGFTGLQMDGNLFFSTKIKEDFIFQTIKVNSNVQYIGEIPIQKRISYGFHGGIGYTDNSFSRLSTLNSFSTMCGVAGISLLSSKHVNLIVDGNKAKGRKNGTTLFRANADMVFYFNKKYIAAPGNNIGAGGILDLQEETRNFGYRLYIDGKATIWGKDGRFSINYLLGACKNSDATQRYMLILGAGLGYNF